MDSSATATDGTYCNVKSLVFAHTLRFVSIRLLTFHSVAHIECNTICKQFYTILLIEAC